MKNYNVGILTSCPVPWDKNYDFMEHLFRRQIRSILKYGTKHVYIFGTSGEGYAVTDSQFDRITKAFCEEMNTDKAEPMVGIISLSLQTVIERIERSYGIGVRHFQLSLPAWGECTFAEVECFFNETCGRFEDCSFLHYNNARSKRLITPEEYVLLAERFPNFAATKNGANLPHKIIALVTKTPRLQHFFTDFHFAMACLFGLEVGLIPAISSVNWERAKLFYKACVDRDVEKVGNYIMELEDIHRNLFRIKGQQGHIDGVYDKIFTKISDNDFPLRLLPPYSGVNEKSFLEFARYLTETHPCWSNKA